MSAPYARIMRDYYVVPNNACGARYTKECVCATPLIAKLEVKFGARPTS